MFKSFLTVLFMSFLSLNSYATDILLTKDNTVVFNKPFDSQSVAQASQDARNLDSLTPSSDPIYLILNSPGGDIEAGIELINTLNSLNRPVYTISQFSASMGFQTVQGIKGKRYIINNGTLMAHRAKGQFSGEFPGQLDSRYMHAIELISKLNVQTVERTNGKLTLVDYADLIRDEYWCSGQKCVDAGFVDEVVSPKCGESLNGTKEDTISFFFMGMSIELDVELSNCPLITGILHFSPRVNGENMITVSQFLPTDVIEKLENKIKEVTETYSNHTNKIIKY